LGYIFVAEIMGRTSTAVTRLTPKCPDFGEIAQNNGHYAVRGHSRPPISVPM